MTKLEHFDSDGGARFVTFCCYRQLPFLSGDLAKQVFLRTLELVRNKHGFKLYAYVIMPEHVRLVLHPPEGMKLGLVVRELKSLSARRFFLLRPVGGPNEKRVFWQRRCFDYNCRTPENTIQKINYCHNNPVKRGLVTDPGDWPWSSYNCYHGSKYVPLVIDRVET